MNYDLEAKAGSPGVVADPNRRLREDDYLIFISKTSDPAISSNHDDFADFEAEAVLLEGKARRLSVEDSSEVSDLELKNVLICGWRREWSYDPARFAARVKDVCSGLASGSTITTINPLEDDFMQENIFTNNAEGKPGWHEKDGGGYELEGYVAACGN